MAKKLQIDASGADLFFVPERGKSKKVSPSRLLAKFGEIYCPDRQYCSATLTKKMYHSQTDKSGDVCAAVFQALCSADKHSEETGKRNYATTLGGPFRTLGGLFRTLGGLFRTQEGYFVPSRRAISYLGGLFRT